MGGAREHRKSSADPFTERASGHPIPTGHLSLTRHLPVRSDGTASKRSIAGEKAGLEPGSTLQQRACLLP